MEKTKVSSKGQVIIPKAVRNAQGWKAGQELVVEVLKDGVLLKPKSPFEPTTLDDVAGCLYTGAKPKSLDEMNQAVSAAFRREWRGSR